MMLGIAFLSFVAGVFLTICFWSSENDLRTNQMIRNLALFFALVFFLSSTIAAYHHGKEVGLAEAGELTTTSRPAMSHDSWYWSFPYPPGLAHW